MEEIIKYEIKSGDTLDSIASSYSLKIEELINFHNLHCGTTNFIIGDKLPIHLQFILLQRRTEQEEREAVAKTDYQKKARYRCEQFNTTKEDRITFHCNTKKEYEFEKGSATARVKLKEYFYKINPESLSPAIEAVKELEFDKENVVLTLNEDNTINEVVNFEEIKKKWNSFKPKLSSSKFYSQIEKINPKAAEDILKGGQLEFESESNLRKTYDKQLLFHVLFNDFDANKKGRRMQF